MNSQRTATIVLGLFLLWAWSGLTGDLPLMLSGVSRAIDYMGGMWPPDAEILPRLASPLVETVQMAIAGTSLATVVAVPLSFFAARNTSPSGAVCAAARGFINFLRGIPTLVWALLFVTMVGLGPLAGVFAITLHCIGTLGKYFSEAVEAISPETQEVLEAMHVDGATPTQATVHGIVPAVTPLFLGFILYHLESNIRSATVLGMVGAGGIGLYLTQTIRLFKRHQTLTAILVILCTVLVMDALSWQIRRRFLL